MLLNVAQEYQDVIQSEPAFVTNVQPEGDTPLIMVI